MQSKIDIDYITLSGSGEPTLHAHFGEVLNFLKKSPIPSLLLTNGTMLYLPEVREAASCANTVKISLSAWDDRSYEWVNRPHPGLTFDQLITGQKEFRSEFKGELWMEVLLMLGINSMPDDVKKIAEYAQTIKPDRIQLNTVVRPPSEDFAVALPKDRLKSLRLMFDPPAEIIAEGNQGVTKNGRIDENAILTMLQRRPCSSEQIAKAFNIHLSEVSKYLTHLIDSCRIHTDCINSTIYYSANTKEEMHSADKRI
jgi:wyosine [tRNA(Phe)-imidazoG37] synthetase (radical SAM superfamily)